MLHYFRICISLKCLLIFRIYEEGVIGESLFHTDANMRMDTKPSFPHTGHGEGQLQPQVKHHCEQKSLQEYPPGATVPAAAFLDSWLSIPFHLLSFSWWAEKLELFTPVKLGRGLCSQSSGKTHSNTMSQFLLQFFQGGW